MKHLYGEKSEKCMISKAQFRKGISNLCSALDFLALKLRSLVERTDVMILKIFLSKKSAKKLAFLTQNKAKLSKNLS
jgi:hypothetical protein